MSLKTNYKDEMLKSGEQRRYNLVASNGSTLYSNVRLEKAYTPQVEGDKFSAKDINDTNKAINDINDSMKYSLSAEQYTGQRWLNGEKIYRKIITWNNITSGVKNVAHGISNIKEFVNYDVTLNDNKTFYKLPIVYYSNADSGTFYDIYARINNINIEIISNSNWSNYKVTAILYYTKTVDK